MRVVLEWVNNESVCGSNESLTYHHDDCESMIFSYKNSILYIISWFSKSKKLPLMNEMLFLKHFQCADTKIMQKNEKSLDGRMENLMLIIFMSPRAHCLQYQEMGNFPSNKFRCWNFKSFSTIIIMWVSSFARLSVYVFWIIIHQLNFLPRALIPFIDHSWHVPFLLYWLQCIMQITILTPTLLLSCTHPVYVVSCLAADK